MAACNTGYSRLTGGFTPTWVGVSISLLSIAALTEESNWFREESLGDLMVLFKSCNKSLAYI